MIYIGKYYYLLPWRCPRTPRPHARGLREHILVREHWSDVGCGCGRVCASLCIVRECATAAGESERLFDTRARIPHGHTLRCPRSIPSSSCASIASFSCTTTSLLRCTSRHTWPSLLSLSAHRVTSDGLSPLQTHVPLPPVPPRPTRISRAT